MVTLDDFYVYLPKGYFIFKPTGQRWVKGGINASLSPVPLFNDDGSPMLDAKGRQVTMKPADWLMQHRGVF